MATGHYLGDTGDFSQHDLYRIYLGARRRHRGAFLENDAVLGDVDEHFKGDYLDEDTVLKLAREKGFSTAAMGKLGPTLIFDHTDRTGQESPSFSTIPPAAITACRCRDEVKDALTKAGLPLATPARGDNGKAGDAKTPGTTVANVAQQAYFADVATKVVLPMFKARNKPFVLVFWSRDPDGSQHNQGDSLNTSRPASTGRHRSPASRMPTTISRSFARRLTISASLRPPISSSPPTTASRPSPRRARPARRPRSATTTRRRTSCPWASSRSISPRRSDLPLFDPDDKNARRRRRHPSEGRQWPDRPGSGQARPRGRHQWRLRPDLSAQQGQEARRAHHRNAAGAGLCQRAVCR